MISDSMTPVSQVQFMVEPAERATGGVIQMCTVNVAMTSSVIALVIEQFLAKIAVGWGFS